MLREYIILDSDEGEKDNLSRRLYAFLKNYFRRLGVALDQANASGKGVMHHKIFERVTDCDYFSWDTFMNSAGNWYGRKGEKLEEGS